MPVPSKVDLDIFLAQGASVFFDQPILDTSSVKLVMATVYLLPDLSFSLMRCCGLSNKWLKAD